MIEGVRNTLAKIDEVVPGYDGQGCQIAGFAWWQGHKDAGATKEEYEKHLVNLINDVGKELQGDIVTLAVAGFPMKLPDEQSRQGKLHSRP